MPIQIPDLKPKRRDREYKAYSDELRASVVLAWLINGRTHRELDTEVLGLDAKKSKGYQAMGILHHLGLTGAFRGIFAGSSTEDVIAGMDGDSDAARKIVALLKDAVGGGTMSLAALQAEEQRAITQSLQDSGDERKARLAKASRVPARIRVYSFTYRRNPDIVAEALARADGHCERCKSPAPFNRKVDNTPFLEVHHIQPLASRGMDAMDNVLALCPNCHRCVHHGL